MEDLLTASTASTNLIARTVGDLVSVSIAITCTVVRHVGVLADIYEHGEGKD